MTPLARRQLLVGAAAVAVSVTSGGASAQPVSAGQGLLARLRAAKKVRIGIANQPPFSALNPDGTMTGAAPAIAKLIMGRLGIPEMEGFIATYGELIPGMQAGRWDFVGAALTITAARCTQVLFADPLVFDGAALVWSKGTTAPVPTRIADIAKLGVAMGVEAGGADLRASLAAGMSPANIRQFSNDPSILDGLLAKRIDYAVMSHSPLKGLFQQRNLDLNVVYPLPDDPPHGASCAFRTVDTDLHDAFQAELRAMKASGEYLTVIRQFGFDTPPQLMSVTAEQACAS